MTESTYADVTHPSRDAVERAFADAVRHTVWDGGTVVVPAFAIGRTQEVLLVCDAFEIDCYVDGMGVDVTESCRRNPEYLRDPAALRSAAGRARVVDGGDEQRRRIAAENAVIVTTAGMLTGGPAMTYVPSIRDHPGNLIALTGYQVAGTPGRELLETGSAAFDGRVLTVSARVEQYDFSAHADRAGLSSFLGAYGDSEVLVVHGDDTAGFAEALQADGYAARAPAVGDRLVV